MDVKIHLEIIGLIWRRADDGITLSAHFDHKSDVRYLEILDYTRHIQRIAQERGVSVGDICDEINQEISRRVHERRIVQGIPSFELEFQVTGKQADAFSALFEAGL